MSGTLPNFLIIGAMKAGTTSLYHYLRSHPEVFMPEEKEIHFFNRDQDWELGAPWYERFFEDAGEAIAVGEASPGYAMYPHRRRVPERIASLVPDVRLVYVIRHPIERMRSHYAHFLVSGRDVLPINDELVVNPLYLDMSRYALQIEQYLEHFDQGQLLIVLSEDLRHHRTATMHTVFSHLGVEPEFSVPTGEFHRTSEKRKRTRFGTYLQRLPGYELARRTLPEGTRKSLYRTITAPAADPSAIEILPETMEALEDELKDDVKRLHEYLSRADFDGWGIA